MEGCHASVQHMTTLHDLFDYDQFLLQVASGNIVVRKNDSGTLSIANYGPTVQFSRSWTPETTASRGLIYETDTLKVIARPWAKFFNWDDSIAPYPPSGAVIKSEKFDGSMGILYYDASELEFRIASRGSFGSEQALKATEMFYAQDPDTLTAAIEAYHMGKTLLFEILYPENRIVLSYGEDERLVLLDVLDVETGKPDFDAFDNIYWFDKADKTLLPGFIDTMAGDIPKDKEGFVLYWPHSDFRCKVKGADYIALHSILTDTSSRKIWQYLAVNECRGLGDAKALGQGLGMDPRDVSAILSVGDDWITYLIADVPDEFYDWVSRTIDSIDKIVDANLLEIRTGVQTIHNLGDVDSQTQYHAVSESKFRTNMLSIARSVMFAEDRAVLSAWKNAYPLFEKPFSNNN